MMVAANKIENQITFFLITIATFLLNFKSFSLFSIIFGFFLATLFILLFEKLNNGGFEDTPYEDKEW